MKIQIEGIDGAGKSEQAHLLAKRLSELHISSVVVKEHEASEFSRELKTLLLSAHDRSPLAEMFVFLAIKSEFSSPQCRFQSNEHICIMDRGWLSFLVPTCVSGRVPLDMLKSMLKVACQESEPPITVLLDIDPEVAQRRLRQANRNSRFDTMGETVYHQQRSAYLELLDTSSPHIVIDGSLSLEEISKTIWRFLETENLI